MAFAADGFLCAIVVLGAICGLFGMFSNRDALATVERVKRMERAADARDRKAAQKLATAEAKRELAERWAREHPPVPVEAPAPATPFRPIAIPHAPVTPTATEPPPVPKAAKVAKPRPIRATPAPVAPPAPDPLPEPTPTPAPAKVAAVRPPAAKVSVAPAKVARRSRKDAHTFDPAPVKARKGCPTHPFGSGYCPDCAKVNERNA